MSAMDLTSETNIFIRALENLFEETYSNFLTLVFNAEVWTKEEQNEVFRCRIDLGGVITNFRTQIDNHRISNPEQPQHASIDMKSSISTDLKFGFLEGKISEVAAYLICKYQTKELHTSDLVSAVGGYLR